MEENTSIFSLAIDALSKTQLREVAKWARLFGIAGIVALALIVTNSLLMGGFFLSVSVGESVDTASSVGYAVGRIIGALLVSMIPLLTFVFALRFANKLKNALDADDQRLLNASFQQLKICFRYTGILAILFLALMAIAVVLRLVSGSV